MAKSKDPDQRFWNKIELADSCWIWTGAKINTGYGVFRANGKAVLVHRWLFQRLGNTIPIGCELDHICRTPLCVNPAHLEPVTHRENNARGAHNWHPTRCPRGHDYDGLNTGRRKSGHRECKTCKAERKRTWRARRKAWILANLENSAAKAAMRKL
jgi:hypothetical protein